MDDSIAHPPLRAGAFEVPAWKSALSVSSAVLLALLFIVAGTWKITDPFGAAARMVQAKVPADLGLLAAISLGIGETFAGVLLLIPRYRRWGAWVTGLLLVAFMIYIGAYYNVLRGEECSCFPWLKRAVGPGFFIGDGIMLLLAVAAGLWARKSDGMRNAAIILGAVSVFALTSFGVTYARQTGIKAPDSITVNGAPQSLQHGKVFIYFFDPECSHCFQAAQAMAKYNWRGEVNLIAVPTAQPRFADQFLKDTGFTKAKVSNDLQVLKDTFKFTAGPYAVALENGRQKLGTLNFEGDEPARSLRQLDFID
jgi:uncharacterized membrane protein YphA (DoxX/SURF4 family)